MRGSLHSMHVFLQALMSSASEQSHKESQEEISHTGSTWHSLLASHSALTRSKSERKEPSFIAVRTHCFTHLPAHFRSFLAHFLKHLVLPSQASMHSVKSHLSAQVSSSQVVRMSAFALLISSLLSIQSLTQLPHLFFCP